MNPAGRINRRQALAAGATAAAISIVPRPVLGGPGQTPPSERLNIAGVGIGGQGGWDLEQVKDQNIVALADVDWGYAAHTLGQVSTGHQIQRLPRDARQGKGNRRGRRGHAGPCARDRLDGGHQAGKARLLREAAHPHGLRGPRLGHGRPGTQGRHPDGKPGYGLRGQPADDRVARRRRDWLSEGGARLVRSADAQRQAAAVLGARNRAAQGTTARSRLARLGPVARPGALAALPSGLRPFPVAGLVGFRFRRPGRHGDSQPCPSLLRAEARGAGVRVRQFDSGVPGDAAPGLLRALRVPCPRRHAPRQAALVRRWTVAAAPR